MTNGTTGYGLSARSLSCFILAVSLWGVAPAFGKANIVYRPDVDTEVTPKQPAPSGPAPALVNSGLNAEGKEWLLPFYGRLDSSPASTLAGSSTYVLHGSVTNLDLDTSFAERIDSLLDASLSGNDFTKKLDWAVAHYRTKKQQQWSDRKDFVNKILPYRGFGASIDAGDVIIGDKIKVKNEASANYARQRYIDELHPKIVARVMQIAMGMGMADKARGAQTTASGVSSLKALVGEKEALKTVDMLKEWGKNLKIPSAVYSQPSWDVETYQGKLKTADKLAMTGDPVVTQINTRLKKMIKHNAISRTSRKSMELSMDIGTFVTPGFILPGIMQLAEAGYIMSTGGTEESKLTKELYFDKRLESRWRAINEESQLALTHYQLAIANHNPMLLACSESVLSQLVGGDNIPEVLGLSVLAHKPPTTSQPIQTASKRSTVQ